MLTINGPNSLIKRHRLAEQIYFLKDQYIYLQEIHFKSKEKQKLKVKGWEKLLHGNGNEKKAEVPLFISDKI